MATAESELPAPEDLDDDQQEAVGVLLRRLADDEFVMAERYTEWQVRAPTLESDLALSNIAQDELGHARLWYDLLEDFGYEEPDYLWESDPGDWRHATLAELPYETGDWADAVLRGYLYDVAEDVRLDALEESSYPRIRDRVGKIQGEEDYHREHAQNWLERLTEEGDGRDRLQDALERLFPHALTIFASADPEIEERIDDLGLRTATLSEMGERWLETAVPYLESLGLEPPEAADGGITPDEFPEAIGRDGDHTDHWPELFDEVTHTYDELGRSEANRIMGDPDDE